jgi:glycosyltransferase involved in cell wall biosynthesis
MNNNYAFREKFYQYTLNQAFIILCESETGARELKNFYSFYNQKIKVLPSFPGYIVNHSASESLQESILKKYNVKKDLFFLYPAQFWPHKNHYNLILAFHKLIKENNNGLKLLLCGSNKGNLRYINELIRSLSLQDSIVIPGFVNDDELFTFYKNAIALTMPTFLGPTNLPIIEAATLKCPVLCSNLEGHKELLGNYALYFEPSDANAIAEAMNKMLDNKFREEMIKSAYAYTTQSPFTLEKSLQRLNEILLDTKAKRKTWGVDYFL